VIRAVALDETRVLARRQDDDHESVLARAELRLLSQLDAWRTADEVGVAGEALDALVEKRLAFWSHARPERVLTARPTGGNALADNVFARPLTNGLVPFPSMPRLGELDHAKMTGMRLEVYEWETAVAQVTVACCARHAAIVRDLIPRLDGRVVDLADAEREIVNLLDDAGLLATHTPARRQDDTVTGLAHAGVCVDTGGRRILIDPDLWPRSRPTRHETRPYDPRDLGDVDAVLVTHGDHDHFSPNLFLRSPRTVPVVIPRAKRPQPYHVDMARLLAILGFTNVIEVDEWQELRFGDVRVIAAPFRGEDWGLELPTRTYVVASPALTVYANADSLTDPAALYRIAQEHAIDLALVGVTGAAESHAMPPGFGYGDFYAPWIPRERHDEWVLLCNGPRAAAEAAERLHARHAFGYAAGGAPFCNLAYSDRGTHAEMAAHLKDTRPLELLVGVPTKVPHSD
jgi:L-ascorbate metabolism protein UlaG (beta-lactamase superfamily)